MTLDISVLFPKPRLQQEEARLFIVDWEFAQFGHRAYDIGQIIGDLYERKHFMGVEGAIWAIDGFIDGYGTLSEDMAFRAAIHAGVQMITWVTRGPPLHMRAGWATREKAADIVNLGMNIVLKGWEKDKGWFKSSVLSGLFSDDIIPTGEDP